LATIYWPTIYASRPAIFLRAATDIAFPGVSGLSDHQPHPSRLGPPRPLRNRHSGSAAAENRTLLTRDFARVVQTSLRQMRPHNRTTRSMDENY
jgi:hypothetical protein